MDYNVKITDETRDKISKSVARIVEIYKKDKDIEGIYLLIYKGEEPSYLQGNVLELTITTSYKGRKTSYDLRDIPHRFKTSDNKDISLVTDLINEPKDLFKDNILFNSILLYDRDGRYTKAKEQMQKEYEDGSNYKLIPYGNLLTIEPPIDDKIKEEIGKLDKKRILVMPLNEQTKKEEE